MAKAQYLQVSKTHTTRTATFRWQTILCAFLSVFIFSITLLQSPVTSFADGDDKDSDTKFVEEGNSYLKDHAKKDKDGNVDGVGTIGQFMSPVEDRDSFGYVLWRLFAATYINQTTDNSQGKDPINCKTSNPLNGTPLYHNCDVPNLLTELRQDLMAVFVPPAIIVGADQSSNKLLIPAFGLPSNIPNGGAPADPMKRKAKYTGLELFGYNFHYTSYYGEWDHINVMTKARALTNFGIFDGLKLGVTATFKGIGAGISKAGSNAWSELKEGDVIGAIGGLFSGFFEGAASKFLNVFLDTSDQNVFDTNAWYRTGYGKTIYNGRELTNVEVLVKAQELLQKAIESSSPEKANAPDDLKAVSEPPPAIGEKIPLCKVRASKDGELEEFRKGEKVTKAECEQEAQSRAENSQGAFQAESSYSEDGAAKEQTLAEWKTANKKYVDAIGKYSIDVKLDDKEENKKATIDALRAAWPEAYKKACEKAVDMSQADKFVSWFKRVLSIGFSQIVLNDRANNFNAPWNRFICVNSNGEDVTDKDGKWTYTYDADGNLSPGCDPLRPPIQNGYYGNGYLPDDMPGKDTRYMVDGAFFNSLFDSGFIANGLLNIASFATQVSNTFLNLSFAPLLKTLGIDTLAEKIISIFRDTIFFPLVLIMFLLLGGQVMWRSLARLELKAALLNVGAAVGIFCLGIMLMFNPKWTFKLVDEYPAQLEQAILSAIYKASNNPDDVLCTADNGKIDADSFDANMGLRSMMCENWRAFAFNPWVFGQFGTNLNHLYSNGSGKNGSWTNENSRLVGDAAVVLGGGVSIRNWGVYQLEATSFDTASYVDTKKHGVGISPNFYRIVDAQAGPNNGKDSYGRYFGKWSGMESSRLGNAFFGAGVAILGAITVITYAVAKITVTFTVTILLMVLPLMFLFGILAGQTRTKFKSYIATLIGLVAQRVLFTLLLAVMFRFLFAIGNESENYFVCAVALAVTCIIFLMYKNEFVGFIESGVSQGLGAPTMSQFSRNPKEMLQNASMAMPKVLANAVANGKRQATGAVTGFTASILTGSGFKRAMQNARKGARAESNREFNRQRSRGGFSVLQRVRTSSDEGRKNALDEHVADDHFQHAQNDVRFVEGNKQSAKDYRAAMEEWKKLPERVNIDGKKERYNPATGKTVAEPSKPFNASHVYSGDLSPKDMRDLAKVAKIRRKAEAKFEAVYHDDKATIEEVNKAYDELVAITEGAGSVDKIIKSREEQYAKSSRRKEIEKQQEDLARARSEQQYQQSHGGKNRPFWRKR